jgi:hypothetical protein
MVELTGILRGTGAKMKADIGETAITFRGAVKATVPFADVDAEARGTLLVLHYAGHVIELAAGKKAMQFAQKIQRGGA